MASPVIASKSNQAFASGISSCTITKPTGLAVGDLMVAFVAQLIQNESLGAPGGWSIQYNSDTPGNGSFLIATKEADSADVAASNFTFTSGAGTTIGGAILRVTGIATGTPVAATSVTEYSSSSVTNLTRTVSAATQVNESLVLACFWLMDFTIAGVVTVDSYSISPSITLTEEYDFGIRDGANDGGTLAIASGAYTGSTTFTSVGATASLAVSQHRSGIIIINAPQNANGTNLLLEVTPTMFANAGVAGATGTNNLLEVQPEILNQSGRATQPSRWTNDTKENTTWTNETLP